MTKFYSFFFRFYCIRNFILAVTIGLFFSQLTMACIDIYTVKVTDLLSTFDTEVERQVINFDKAKFLLSNIDKVKAQLTHMFNIDQYIRSYYHSDNVKGLGSENRESFDMAFKKRWSLLNNKNNEIMKSLLSKHEWFKISEWGKEFDGKAWLLIQHADHDFEFQSRILEVLKPLAKIGETSFRNYAYLYDRVAVSRKNPGGPQLQLYGTQGRCNNLGIWEPSPIKNPGQVDHRRAEAGLQPLEDYKKSFNKLCK